MVWGASGWFPLVSHGPLYTAFPDWDIWRLGIGSHRNVLFHSAVFPVLYLIWAYRRRFLREFGMGLCVGVGSHLLVDLCQSSAHYDPLIRGMYGLLAVFYILFNAFLALLIAYAAVGSEPLLAKWERNGM